MKTYLFVSILALVVMGSCKGDSPVKPSVSDEKSFPEVVSYENDSLKVISDDYGKRGQWVENILFRIDEDSTVSVNVLAANPFNHLPFKEIGTSYGTKVYQIDVADPLDYFADYNLEQSDVAYAYGQVMPSDLSRHDKFVTVSNMLYLSDSSGRMAQIIARYDTYNRKGVLTSSVKDGQGGIAEVSLDGRKLMVGYGGRFGEEGEDIIKEGFKILNTKNGKTDLQFEVSSSLNSSNHVYFDAGPYFVLNTRSGEKCVVSFIIDPNQGWVKYMEFQNESRPRIDSLHYYTPEGVYLDNQNYDFIPLDSFNDLPVDEQFE